MTSQAHFVASDRGQAPHPLVDYRYTLTSASDTRTIALGCKCFLIVKLQKSYVIHLQLF